MPRKGENVFHRKDGRWEARFIKGYDDSGRAIYGFVYGKSYSEVKEKRLKTQVFPEAVGKKNEQEKNVKMLCMKWLSDVDFSVKESTFTRYHRAVTKYIIPHIGAVRLDALNAQIINGFSERLLRCGGARGGELSAKSVTDILVVLKSVLKFGVVCGDMPFAIEGIRYPQREIKKIKVVNEANLAELEKIIFDRTDNITIGILISLFTGLRIGEVCGLKWGDVDFRNKLITVGRTVERIADLSSHSDLKTKIIICEPKTESSYRTIPVPDFILNRLIVYYEMAPCDARQNRKEQFVLTNSIRCFEPNKFYNMYRRFMRSQGMNEYSFHALRHTFATRCIEAGFDAKSLSEILGHSNISTTLSVYVHPSLSRKRAQMELLAPSSQKMA